MRLPLLTLPAATAALLLVTSMTPSSAQSQLPRPSQLPPAGGAPPAQRAQPPQQQPPQPQQRGQAPQQQQTQQAQPKPYTPVTISAPQPLSDPSFEAFRKQIEAAATRKDRAALAKLVVAKDFFWEGETGNKADKRKSGADNLAAAMSLAAKDGSGWDALAGFAADPTAMPMQGRKDVMCGPAEPEYDQAKLGALAKATGTEEPDWGYTTQPGLEVRSGPQPNAPVTEKLGMQFVWVMMDDSPAAQQSNTIKVVTPSGKIGFVPVDAISPLGSDQVCYAKDASGAWKIAGYIGGDQ